MIDKIASIFIIPLILFLIYTIYKGIMKDDTSFIWFTYEDLYGSNANVKKRSKNEEEEK